MSARRNPKLNVNLPDSAVTELIADMWAPLTDEQRQFLADNFQLQSYKKHEIIHYEGETPKHMMCLLSGKVKIYKTGVGGRSQIIRMIKPVEYFGYRAAFAHEDYITAAAAFEPSLICLIPMEAITTLVAQNNDLALFFIRQLSVDLGVADERTVNLTQKHIRGRLAESLLFLKESYGLEEDESTLSIYLSREDLANLSNMTTSNAIRTLSQFSVERLIAIDGRKIKIIDEERLRRISKIG
jgi:CRP-like cAMP-binding protein